MTASAVAAKTARPGGGLAPAWVLLFCLVSALYGGPATADRHLFIGNSYLADGGGVHTHAAALASSAVPERMIEVSASTIRGSRLDEQDISASLAGAPYDTVVLQGHSTAALTEATRARFRAAVRRAHQEIAAQGGKTVLYMTPAYSPAHPRHDGGMFSRIAMEYTDLGREIGAAVIPVGLAYEIAYARRPDIALHQPDGSHATARGIYLAAAVTAAALFEIDPKIAPYEMDGAVSGEDARFLRMVAADAVKLAQDATCHAGMSGAGDELAVTANLPPRAQPGITGC